MRPDLDKDTSQSPQNISSASVPGSGMAAFEPAAGSLTEMGTQAL